VLIDADALIGRKHNSDLSQLLKTLATLKVECLVHPKSNDDHLKIGLSAMPAHLLEDPPDPALDILFLGDVGGGSSAQEVIDNFMLYAVARDAVNYLITENQDLHQKASRVDLSDRVFSIFQAKEFFKNYLTKEKIEHPSALKLVNVKNLDINDPFFDSLKVDYGGVAFLNWFKKISIEERKGYVSFRGKAISALLVLKDEEEPIHGNPDLPNKRRLKLCTFKSEPSGNRLGELFIKIATRFCVENGIDEMYLTHFSKPELEGFDKLLAGYGFIKVARKTNGEDVYVKELIPLPEQLKELVPSQISKFYPSFYDGEDVQKFIVPIRPEYHEILFDDYQNNLRQALIDEFLDNEAQFKVAGNTISKAYLCHAVIKKIRKNDILLFYRSGDDKAITTLGVVESTYRLTDATKIATLVGNRTVYSLEEIEKIAQSSTLVILFRWHFYLQNPVKLKRLVGLSILKTAPQSIMAINDERYEKIKKESNLNERYTIN
jgi:hypothetical protein